MRARQILSDGSFSVLQNLSAPALFAPDRG